MNRFVKDLKSWYASQNLDTEPVQIIFLDSSKKTDFIYDFPNVNKDSLRCLKLMNFYKKDVLKSFRTEPSNKLSLTSRILEDGCSMMVTVSVKEN
jgi:hypothetical protein